jgi:hypothetical protein
MFAKNNLRQTMASATAALALFSITPAQAQIIKYQPWWSPGTGGIVQVAAKILTQVRDTVPSDVGNIPGGFLATLERTAKVPSLETRTTYYPKASDAKDDGRYYYNNNKLTLFAVIPPTVLTFVATTVCGELNDKAVYHATIRSDGKVEQKTIENPEAGCKPIRKAALTTNKADVAHINYLIGVEKTIKDNLAAREAGVSATKTIKIDDDDANPAANAQAEPTWWNTDAGNITVSAQFLSQVRAAVPSDRGDNPRGFMVAFKETVKTPSVETRTAYAPKGEGAPNDGKFHYSTGQLTLFAVIPPTGLTAIPANVCGELQNRAVYYSLIHTSGKVEQLVIDHPEDGCMPSLSAARRQAREAAAAANIK